MLRRRTVRVDDPPRGFRVLPRFITPIEECRLLAEIAELPFEAVVLRGFEARRQVAHFGWRYRYDGGELTPAPPLPCFLDALRLRAIAEARLPPHADIQALVTRYPPGAGIGWHRDAPHFGPCVVGVSLGSACELRLRLPFEHHYELHEVRLQPRSLYVFAGTARFRWQHAIPPVAATRYSVTFRTVERPHLAAAPEREASL